MNPKASLKNKVGNVSDSRVIHQTNGPKEPALQLHYSDKSVQIMVKKSSSKSLSKNKLHRVDANASDQQSA